MYLLESICQKDFFSDEASQPRFKERPNATKKDSNYTWVGGALNILNKTRNFSLNCCEPPTAKSVVVFDKGNERKRLMQSRFFASFFGGIFIFSGAAFGAASCSDNFSKVDYVNASTFVAPVEGVCQIGGYSLITIPDEFEIIYNGFTLGPTVTVCDNGVLIGNECSTYSQGVCASDNYNTAVNTSTFMAEADGVCQIGGYSIKEIPDDLTPVYNGFVLGAEVALCDNGHWSGTTCVPNASGEGNCIENYYDTGINASTFAELTNKNCTSPYVKYTQTTRCDHNPGDTCVDLPTPQYTLTWDDKVNNPTTSTCYFEETITLPPTPVRPGYIFGGWKIKTNN